MKKRIIIDILFVVYILVLLSITVLRSGIGSQELFSGKINIIPFIDLIDTFKKSPTSFIYLFLGNIIWFVPIGFYLRKMKDCKIITTVAIGFCLSFFIEIMQYIFGTGMSEIDDLILNTIGVLIGNYAACLFDKIECKIAISHKTSCRIETIKSISYTVTLTAVLIVIWGIIFLTALVICFACPFWRLSRNFDTVLNIRLFLIIIFITMNIMTLIIFRRKLNKIWKYPLLLIVSSLVIFSCGIGVLDVGCRYYGHFTPQKWIDYPEYRYLMIDSLEQKYEIVGMSKQDITDLLGNPTNINRWNGCYEYFIDSGFIDCVTYDIYFDNDIAVKTSKMEH